MRRPSPYRFLFQIQKAIELAGKVRELGGALLSAFEKGDAEYLAAIHARAGTRAARPSASPIRQDQWRDADWQVQALQQTKDVNQTNLLYYTNLYQAGLINDEIQYLNLTTTALQIRTGANIVEAAGEVMNIIPDFFVGAMSSGRQLADRHQARRRRSRPIAQDHARPSPTSRAPPPALDADRGRLAAPLATSGSTRCRCCRSRSSRSSSRSSARSGAGTRRCRN